MESAESNINNGETKLERSVYKERPFYLEIDTQSRLNLLKKYRNASFADAELVNETQKRSLELFHKGVQDVAHQAPKDFGAIYSSINEIVAELSLHLGESDKEYARDLLNEIKGIFDTIKLDGKERSPVAPKEFLDDFGQRGLAGATGADFYYLGMEAVLLDVPERFVAFSNKYEDFVSRLKETNPSIELQNIIKKFPLLKHQSYLMSDIEIHLHRKLNFPKALVDEGKKSLFGILTYSEYSVPQLINEVMYLSENIANQSDQLEQVSASVSRINKARRQGTSQMIESPKIIFENKEGASLSDEDIVRIIPLLLKGVNEARLQSFISELVTDIKAAISVRFEDNKIEISFPFLEINGLGLDRINIHYKKSEEELFDEVCEVTKPWILRREKGKFFIEKN